MASVRVAIRGAGQPAPSSLIQGVEFDKDADPSGTVPGLRARRPSATDHVSDVEVRRWRSTSTTRRSARTWSEAIDASAEQHDQHRRGPVRSASTSSAARRLDGLEALTAETIEESAAEPVDVVAVLKEAQGRRPGPDPLLRGVPSRLDQVLT